MDKRGSKTTPDALSDVAGQCASGACPKSTDPCTDNTCDTDTGTCKLIPVPEGDACDDGLFCTVNTTCQSGACINSKNETPCPALESGCQIAQCNEVAGKCDYSNATNDQDCDSDNDPCTNYKCSDGECIDSAATCDDNNPCTTDLCDGGCIHKSLPDFTVCDDGEQASSPDMCLQGQCRGAKSAFAQPPIGSCPVTKIFATALTENSDSILSLSWFLRSTSTTCQNNLVPSASFHELNGNALEPYSKLQKNAQPTVTEGRVILGKNSLVGTIRDDGTVNWTDKPLANALVTSIGKNIDYNYVAEQTVDVGGGAVAEHYLISGTDGETSESKVVHCVLDNDAWQCELVVLTQSLTFNIRASGFAKPTDCNTTICESLGTAWLGSDDDEIIRVLHSPNDSLEFSIVDSFDGKLKDYTLQGAVVQSATTAWFYGDGGLLRRCAYDPETDKENAVKCVAITKAPAQSTLNFVDADLYDGNLLFLAKQDKDGVIVFLPMTADPLKPEAYRSIKLPDFPGLASIRASSTGGLHVLGRSSPDDSVNRLRMLSFEL